MIILASASPRRYEILKQAGVEFEVIPSKFDEESLEFTNINDYSKALSYHKAIDVYNNHPNDTIIASDTIVVVNDEILGKPKDKKDAYRMLSLLSGKKHSVITSVCIIHQGKIDNFLSKSYVTFYKMSEKDIEEYIATNEPMDKAGAYAIQGKAAKYIRSINGDYYTIVGLPIGKVIKSLKKLKALSI
ncbi:MAG: septum formation protein Maf [Bacilli bacterium]|nr:septum formation protein Maf [Bacilli bacterium]